LRAFFSAASLLLAVLSSRPAFAGHETGNGGGGVVCDGEARRVELLDLWEGKALKGLVVEEKATPVLAQIDRAIDIFRQAGLVHLSERTGALAREMYNAFTTLGRGRLPNGIAVAPPTDALNRFIPRGCRLEGIALYNDRFSTLDIDGQLFDELTPTSQAALFVHEGLYKYLREEFSENDSTVARNFVACAFSESSCPELSPSFGLPTRGPLFSCKRWDVEVRGKPNTYWIYPADPGAVLADHAATWRFQVSKIGSVEPPGKAYFDILVTNLSGYLQNGLYGTMTLESRDYLKHVATRSSEQRWQDIGVVFHDAFEQRGDHIDDFRCASVSH
jgi:hypothetical protein